MYYHKCKKCHSIFFEYDYKRRFNYICHEPHFYDDVDGIKTKDYDNCDCHQTDMGYVNPFYLTKKAKLLFKKYENS